MIEQLVNQNDIKYIETIGELINSNNIGSIELTLNKILNRMHIEGPIIAEDFEKLTYIKIFHPNIFRTFESELLYLMGLFYKVDNPKNLIEEIYSIFSNTIAEEIGTHFTPIQAEAYKYIKNKKFFSFSAPTSAGKSYLFKELIVNEQNDIVIVVPSRALIAEYITTVKSLVNKSVLVLQFIENINIKNTKRRVFIITPERGLDLFQFKNKFNISLFLFDEAQISEDEIRGVGFDAFVRRTEKDFPNSSKVFAHPYVKNPEAQLEKHKFLGLNSAFSLYEQYTVGKAFIAIDNNQFFYFSPYNDKVWENKVPVKIYIIKNILKNNGTILIYTSKNKLYDKTYIQQYWQYLKFCPRLKNPDALNFIEQLRSYIGASKKNSQKISLIVNLMKRGIVIHHGSMPLKMRLIIEQFVRANHAKLCFATSTLKQGINMPFDAVFLDNYTKMDILTLKNLIGRSGRTTINKNNFDFGYTFIHKKNLKSFCQRINENYKLNEQSLLEENYEVKNEDNLDLIEAIKNYTFDDETRLTKTQINRIEQSDIDKSIKFILDNLLIDNNIITGTDYYNIPNSEREKIKKAFKDIYIVHLRRDTLTNAEQGVLSTSIPILLWHIQGKSFKEVLALRYSYLTNQTEQRKIKALFKKGNLSKNEMNEKIKNLKIKISPAPITLPNIKAKQYSNFPKNTSVNELDYDNLVFDTYDYIDKVISLSLSNPLCAAFNLYFKKTEDKRALIMCNYIKFGTNDLTEIWLLKYGFAFEDISWLKNYILKIDENEIVFKPDIVEINKEKFEIIERFI